MTKKMLIDATHKEETRVAVVSGNRLEEYDFESTLRKNLKSNIYLVKVTRVEPSLQAAFIDFGGNRHGFLPFPEIHPDYYRIPVDDREALLAEEEAAEEEEAKKQDALEKKIEDEALAKEKAAKAKAKAKKRNQGLSSGNTTEVNVITYDLNKDEKNISDEDISQETSISEALDDIETVNNESELVEADEEIKPRRRRNLKRHYKIQEVIKRNQIMLIQVGKEERGNKGAAVTSYISLPGRYCVLMPNSPRAGGVSRKVSNIKDRQRLKKILSELKTPDGMSVILRTAGVARTKVEIKRDLDYLLRLWNNIRELTLGSTAPALVHEEGNLVKRSIRDLYKRDIDEILVAGEESYKVAKSFMKTLMPSHAKRIQEYTDDTIPLFFRYQVENQIDAVHNPEAQLKSGGYLVINPTEALVSVDVNSGRATKGRHIEETAFKTNMEAAEEVARQLKLRDLGGLVVIDFIDMEEPRNNRAVEQKLKQAMQTDRARIQIGRISTFGLLELSRQRLRPSLVEMNFEPCVQCHGTGLIRTLETTAIIILRAIEEEGIRGRASELRVSVPTDVALYLLNQKRDKVITIESRHKVQIRIEANDKLIKPDFNIELLKTDESGQVTIIAVEDSTKKKKHDGHHKTKDDDAARKPPRRRRRNSRNKSNNPDNQASENSNAENKDAQNNIKTKPHDNKKTPPNANKQTDGNAVENKVNNTQKQNEQENAGQKKKRPPRRNNNRNNQHKNKTNEQESVNTQKTASNNTPAVKKDVKTPAPVVTKTEKPIQKAPVVKKKEEKKKSQAPDVIKITSNNNTEIKKSADVSSKTDAGKKKGWWQRLTE